jgi:ATP-dependent helicase/DNAse subunit B
LILEIERYRLLRKVVAELKEARELEYFDLIADKPGLISALTGFIDELWRSGTTPDAFAVIAKARNEKDRDIARIFAAYSNELTASEQTEPEGAGVLALEAIDRIAARSQGSQGEKAALPFTLVAADGFNFYNAVQVKLLSRLATLGVEVVATLTYEENRAIHIWQGPTRARLAGHAAEVVNCMTMPGSVIDLAATRFMREAETAEESPVEQPHPDSDRELIEIISAPDRLAEVRAVAREIERLVREERFDLDEIAVICRSLHPYTAHLERVFDEYSIPLRCERSAALGQNPLIIAILRLLNQSEMNFQRRSCLDCLRSPYFDLRFAELAENSINMLERLSMDENVIRGCDQWREAIIATGERVKRRDEIDEIDEETSTERRERYSRLCEKLDLLFEALTFSQASTRRDYATAIIDLLEKLKVTQRLGVSEMSGRDRVAFDTFLKLLTTLSQSRYNQIGEVGWSDFLSEIDNAVAATTFEPPAQAGPAVVAQEIHNLRPRRYRAVFILGMVEGEFPIRATERSPYTLFEREELRGAGIDLTETTADAGADLAQFYRAMSMATDRLALSFPRTDLAGGELLPSYLVDEVKLVAPTRELRIAPAYSTAERRASNDTASLLELASATAARIREGLVDAETEAAQELLNSKLKSWPNTVRAAAIERARINGTADRFNGLIEDSRLLELLDEMFGPEHMWYASQINDYGICPFRFFASHVLGLGHMDQPVEGFLANQLGTAYHRILEGVYSRLGEKGIEVTPDVLSTVREVAEEAGEAELEKMVEKRELRKNALWEFEKGEIKKRIAKLLEKESSWNTERPAKPKHFERAFGKSGKPPLVIKDEDEEIKICGVIDRIDEREDGCVVIDYKTGRTPIHYNEALDGRNLQLPIYMMAAIRVVSPGAQLAAAYYLHINSRKRGSELPHKDNPELSVEAVIDRAEKRIRDYGRSVRKGRFPVSPNKGRCPNYCEFEVMCRIHSIGGISAEQH